MSQKMKINESVFFLALIFFIFGLMFYNYTIERPIINKELDELTEEYNKLNKYIEYKLQSVQTIKKDQGFIINNEIKLINRLNYIINKDSLILVSSNIKE